MNTYINADKLKEFISTHDYRLSDRWNSTDKGMFTIGIFEAIDEQPIADVRENVHGEWVKMHWKAFKCSECKKVSEYYTDFCPNCGADMRGTKTASDTKGGWDGEYYLEDC